MARANPGNGDERSSAIRVMVIVKATKNSEAGVMPSEKLLIATLEKHTGREGREVTG